MFATNSDFLNPIYLQPNVVDLRYLKVWILLDQIMLVEISKVCTIWFQRYRDNTSEFVAKTQFV